MPDDGTTRNRRYRKHARGDHTECLSSRCRHTGNVTPPVTRNVTPAPPPPVEPTPIDDAPDGLKERGRRLWRDLGGGELGPAQRVLLEEACRITDRLDHLDRYLAGDGWLDLDEQWPGSGRLIVVVDRALAEARQQSVALKQLLTELRQSATAGARRGRPLTASGKGPAGVADLAARIADRRASSKG